MSFADRRLAAVGLLSARGAGAQAHPGGTLLAHLERVSDLLRDWDSSEDMQLAGLCHAAYGTDGYDVALLTIDERSLLAAAIGSAAEQRVYSYASCDRSRVYPLLGGESVVWHDRFTRLT